MAWRDVAWGQARRAGQEELLLGVHAPACLRCSTMALARGTAVARTAAARRVGFRRGERPARRSAARAAAAAPSNPSNKAYVNQYGYVTSDALTAPAVVAGCDAEGMLPIARIKCQKQKEAEAEGYASIADKRRAEAAEGYRPNERAAKVEFVDGSVVRTDGQILIPGNAADLKAWALDPNSSGDDQIILLIVVSIAARQAKESFGLDERVSSAIYTVIKALSVAWVSLYWLPDVAEKLGLDV